jgi:RNA polymerase sigma-70 factor (ECF subfamily)
MTLDERVRQLLAAGDPGAAATEAIRTLGPQVLAYLRSLVREEADAREAFSSWAESVWRGLPAFRGEASLRTWTYRLAYHAALGVMGGAWKQRARPFQDGEASRLAETMRTATAVRVDRQRGVLDQLRAQLSDSDRTLLALRIDQQLSWEEIAGVLAEDGERPEPATLAKRFERLKERLRALVNEPPR